MNITPMELAELLNLAIAGDREANSQTNTAKGDNYSKWCLDSMNKANQERDETARKLVELRKEFDNWKASRLQIDSDAADAAMRIQTLTAELATAVRDRDQSARRLAVLQKEFSDWQELRRTIDADAESDKQKVQVLMDELSVARRDRDQAREHLSCVQRELDEYKRTHPHPAGPESNAMRPAAPRKPWEVVGSEPTTFNETE